MKPLNDMQKYLKSLEREFEKNDQRIQEQKKMRLDKFRSYVEQAELLVDEYARFKPRGINLPLCHKMDLSCEGNGGLLPSLPAEVFSILAKKGAETNFIECIKIYLDAFPVKRLISFILNQDQNFIKLCGGLFLIFAAQDNNIELMKALVLQKNVSPHETLYGQVQASALQVLCSLCIFNQYGAMDFEINFKLLVEHGAEIDYQNKNGETALMWVSEVSPLNPGFKLLLDAGANPWLENNKNQNIFSLVRDCYCYEEEKSKLQAEMFAQLEEACLKHEIKESIPQFSKNILNLVWSYAKYRK